MRVSLRWLHQLDRTHMNSEESEKSLFFSSWQFQSLTEMHFITILESKLQKKTMQNTIWLKMFRDKARIKRKWLWGWEKQCDLRWLVGGSPKTRLFYISDFVNQIEFLFYYIYISLCVCGCFFWWIRSHKSLTIVIPWERIQSRRLGLKHKRNDLHMAFEYLT